MVFFYLCNQDLLLKILSKIINITFFFLLINKILNLLNSIYIFIIAYKYLFSFLIYEFILFFFLDI